MITYQNPKYCVAHVKQRWMRRKRTRQNGNLVKSAQIGFALVKWVKRVNILFLGLNFWAIIYNVSGNRVNPFDPFEPHIINRGAKGVIQKFRKNWVTIFEIFEQNGCEIINKKKYGHPVRLDFVCTSNKKNIGDGLLFEQFLARKIGLEILENLVLKRCKISDPDIKIMQRAHLFTFKLVSNKT
ncbi:hypothetical protein BpHYR1_045973 [Brachionus plicatilis]|uniref:Uncharacterized protein n=1 Tax=Brachionus plicatilis TaxID=10195 RepID=A0A3M7T706_BRAPC|nr:hypothetical protein BpHYR1_045973 [Brachionus plicatilis]